MHPYNGPWRGVSHHANLRFTPLRLTLTPLIFQFPIHFYELCFSSICQSIFINCISLAYATPFHFHELCFFNMFHSLFPDPGPTTVFPSQLTPHNYPEHLSPNVSTSGRIFGPAEVEHTTMGTLSGL